MKALILNSGLGHRMGDITKTHPKCMTEVINNETILSLQLKKLSKCGITDVVITTGYFDQVLIDYCKGLNLSLNINFVKNEKFAETNYIYSIYCAKDLLHDDILLMHGDIVFEQSVLSDILKEKKSCMKISSSLALPEKDFKAVVEGGHITAVGVEYFEDAFEAQAFYKLNREDWEKWLSNICKFCEEGNTNVYAEKAFNVISNECLIYPFDVKDRLCTEIDTPEDLSKVKEILNYAK